MTASGCANPSLKQQPVPCTLAVLITRGISGCASAPMSSASLDAEAKRFSPAAGKANLYVSRSAMTGGPFLWSVHVDGQPAGRLAVYTYLLLEVEPGAHQATASTGENQHSLVVNARRGENHYIDLAGRLGSLESRVEGRVLEPEQGKAAVRSAMRIEPLRVARAAEATASVPCMSTLYVNPVFGWSVGCPAGWRLDDSDRRFVKLSNGGALVGLHTGSDVQGLSLDRYADDGLRAWAGRLGNVFTQISRRRVTLPSGQAAIEVVHHIGTGVIGKSRKIIFIVGDHGMWIDAETLLDDWPAFERAFDAIVDSFVVPG